MSRERWWATLPGLRLRSHDTGFAIATWTVVLALLVSCHRPVSRWVRELTATSHAAVRPIGAWGVYVAEATIVVVIVALSWRLVRLRRAVDAEEWRLVAEAGQREWGIGPIEPLPLPDIFPAGPWWRDPRDPAFDAMPEPIASPFELDLVPTDDVRTSDQWRARHVWVERQWTVHRLDPEHMASDWQFRCLAEWWHAERRNACEQRRKGRELGHPAD